jgi:hypothetical protein
MTTHVESAPLTDTALEQSQRSRPESDSTRFSPASESAENPTAGSSLYSLFRANKRPILVTYALYNIENVLRLSQPFVLGLAINDLLGAKQTGLFLLIAQHLAHMLVSSFRRMYDTRAFSAIYGELASGLILSQRERQVGVSRVAARSTLSREYVDFFEQHVPMLIRAFYSVVGALLMLGLYDWKLIPLSLLLVVPALLLNAAYGRKTFEFSGRLHDEFEREVDVIQSSDQQRVRAHYDELARWRVRLSDAEAINFSLMELFVLGVLVASLVHFCTSGQPAAGDIFAVFRYVLMFIMGIDTVPKLVQQISRLRDISYRMSSRTC